MSVHDLILVFTVGSALFLMWEVVRIRVSHTQLDKDTAAYLADLKQWCEGFGVHLNMHDERLKEGDRLAAETRMKLKDAEGEIEDLKDAGTRR